MSKVSSKSSSQSVIMITLTLISAIAGYTWWVYTQNNPDFDKIFFPLTVGEEQTAIESQLLVRRPTTDRIVWQSSSTEHWSAPIELYWWFTTKVTYIDWGVDIVLGAIDHLPDWVVFILTHNDTLLGNFSSNTARFEWVYLDSWQNRFIVHVLIGQWDVLYWTEGTPLVAIADIIND